MLTCAISVTSYIKGILQTTDQIHRSPFSDLEYCDNGGCGERRVVSSYSSATGSTWEGARCTNPGGNCTDGRPCANNKNGVAYCHTLHPDQPPGVSRTSTLVLPDRFDPPEAEFYRPRPFRIGKSGRIAARANSSPPPPWLPTLGCASK